MIKQRMFAIILLATLVAASVIVLLSYGSKKTESTLQQTLTQKAKPLHVFELLKDEVHALEVKQLLENTYYAKASIEGNSYYLKMVFNINPPLKGNEKITLNISSNVGMFSITLYSSRLIVDPETGGYCARSWYNIQVANMINKSIRIPAEKPHVHWLNMTFIGNRSKVEVVNLEFNEKLVLYSNLNKTIEVYGNETVKKLIAGPERALAVYGDHYTAFITVPIEKQPPTVDRILIEIAYPKDWLPENVAPWIIISFTS